LTDPAGNSPAVGKPAMLALRWDAAKYLGNPTGGANPANRGAASFSYMATLVYSTKATAPERGVAAHIKMAYTTPGVTKPPNANKKIPGQKPAAPLAPPVPGQSAPQGQPRTSGEQLPPLLRPQLHRQRHQGL
jgi:hypothetical protein